MVSDDNFTFPQYTSFFFCIYTIYQYYKIQVKFNVLTSMYFDAVKE
jgi:hypothetical protein